MSDLRLTWNNDTGSADLVLSAGDLVLDDGLATAVLISLFTDRRAPEGMAPADGGDDPRGWWGDAFPDLPGDEMGSHLWLLERSAIVPETLRKAEDFARAALGWMVTDGLVKAVAVTAEKTAEGTAGLLVSLTRPDGHQETFTYTWRGS